MVAESTSPTLRQKMIQVVEDYFKNPAPPHRLREQLGNILAHEAAEYFLDQDETLQRYRTALQRIQRTRDYSVRITAISIADAALANEGDD